MEEPCGRTEVRPLPAGRHSCRFGGTPPRRVYARGTHPLQLVGRRRSGGPTTSSASSSIDSCGSTRTCASSSRPATTAPTRMATARSTHERDVAGHREELHHGRCERESTPASTRETYGEWWPNDYPAAPFRNDPMADDADHRRRVQQSGPDADGRFKPDVLRPGRSSSPRAPPDRAEQQGVGGVPATAVLLPHGRHEHGHAADGRRRRASSTGTWARSGLPGVRQPHC